MVKKYTDQSKVANEIGMWNLLNEWSRIAIGCGAIPAGTRLDFDLSFDLTAEVRKIVGSDSVIIAVNKTPDGVIERGYRAGLTSFPQIGYFGPRDNAVIFADSANGAKILLDILKNENLAPIWPAVSLLVNHEIAHYKLGRHDKLSNPGKAKDYGMMLLRKELYPNASNETLAQLYALGRIERAGGRDMALDAMAAFIALEAYAFNGALGTTSGVALLEYDHWGRDKAAERLGLASQQYLSDEKLIGEVERRAKEYVELIKSELGSIKLRRARIGTSAVQ